MGSRNLVLLKTHVGSISLSFANGFVYENVLWALASLWVFFCNYMLYSLGLILRYIFRFHVEEGKREHLVPHDLLNQTKRNENEDSKVDVVAEELANLLFPIFENFHLGIEERGETDCPVLLEVDSDINIHQDAKKVDGETKCSVLKQKDSDIHEDEEKEEGETEGSYVLEVVKEIGENEIDSTVSIEGDSNSPQDNREKVEQEKTKEEESFFPDNDYAETSSLVEEPTFLTFTFQQNCIAANASVNIFPSTENVARVKFLEKNMEKALIVQEEKEHSSERFDSGSHKDERVEDREAIQYSYDSEVSNSLSFHLDENKDETEGSSCYGEEEYRVNSMEKTKETMWEDDLDESDFDKEEEDEDEWEHDEVVEQLRMELKNARQGGLATILEEEEEKESPKVVEDLKPLKIEEKIEFKDHIVEIHKVYRCYAEKIRKLDVLNYQTMHAIGLLELKDPLKLMLIPKSTFPNAKPLSQNLWPRKALKQVSDPILKFVQELDGDLELVYVGQVCLSWEILCWQHKKVEELKQYDSKWPRSYNLVAGEFQLFQVLMQRFLENEPFQGPRIQNYVKNRCVIRNLLQVPAIKDDNTKNKKIIKLGEDYAIDSEMLEQIIKESMRVFWEFVRADKDYGNVIKISHKIGIDVKDPAISDLLGNVRTQLQKKERKLKDIVRSGNCIVKKFQKPHEEQIQLDQEQLLAQVGLRLVSRVMQMKKLRKDQLMWCNEKLNRIKFLGRKVQVEPSFLFFPC